MKSEKATILILSQTDAVATSLCKTFESEGYRSLVVDNEVAAMVDIQQAMPTVVIVDRQQHGGDWLREQLAFKMVPFVALRRSNAEKNHDDEVADLDHGFDMVVWNPSVQELLARVRAILRRQQSRAGPSPPYQVGTIRMDLDRHEVTVSGRPVALTPKEFQILRQFLDSPSRVFTRQEMLNRVWGEAYALEEHALDVHMCSLREKIEADPAQPRYLVTVRGVGY